MSYYDEDYEDEDIQYDEPQQQSQSNPASSAVSRIKERAMGKNNLTSKLGGNGGGDSKSGGVVKILSNTSLLYIIPFVPIFAQLVTLFNR